MKKIFGGALMALAISFGIIATTGTTANAQWRNRNSGYNNQQIQQGYQYGVNTGAADAQRRQSYSPQRSRYYKNASTQEFREGFVRGYDQGYRQQSNTYGTGGYRNDGYRNDGYRNDGYGNRRNDGYGNGGYNNGGYNNEQIQQGYNQGLATGAIDGQRGQSYSPQRSKYYQKASTQAYREGFVRGYDEGFRQYRNNGNYQRSNSGTNILDRIFNP